MTDIPKLKTEHCDAESADIARAMCDDLQPANIGCGLVPNKAESKAAQGSLL